MAPGLGLKPLNAEVSGRGGNTEPSRFIWDPLRAQQVHLGSATGRLSDPICTTPAQTPEVWVPYAVASANRLGSEVSAGCVPSSWEQV